MKYYTFCGKINEMEGTRPTNFDGNYFFPVQNNDVLKSLLHAGYESAKIIKKIYY